jgi:eukaryotic-like serine/threonine-protein kinase
LADLREQLQSSLGEMYTIERELGGGGMSRTYVAMERALSRRVVVKVLSPELAAGVSVERFKREILLAAQMQHPHVVPVLSSGDTGGLPWFTMPYVEGESLRVRLVRGPLAIGEAVSILRDVARALAFAHSHGVVHRDIKPDNVLLSQGSATVTDFGIAKAISAARAVAPGATLTMAGTSIGTPAYMAPEQAAGDPNIDHRSDIYAFGAMAYEMLAGRPPFEGSSPAKLLGAHLSEKPRDVRELRGDTPESLAALVMQCLEKDPAARPQEARDLVRVLDSVTSREATTTAPGVLAGRINVGRALAVWAGATALVALTAWAATVVIGLPDWVLPGSLGVMLAGLPAIAFTAWVQRATRRAYTATPTFTPGGTPSTAQGTLATIAIKASPHVSWRRTWMGGALAVGAFVALVVGFMVLRALGIGPAGSLIGSGKLGANDQIIITDFRSPESDSTLGVTVTEALRADLAQSATLRLMPRLAVIDVLRLMRRPPNSRIDFDLARSIASREGVKAVLDGDIVTLGGRYVLSTRLIGAQDGGQLAAFKEEAENQNDLIPAIGRLAKQLRSKVGESLRLVRESSALDRVTTGSLDALRKYVAANVLQAETSDYTQVNPLLEEAVNIDSTFAMAWRRLAQNYNNIGQAEKAQAAAVQAYKYRDRLSEVERQLTIASYYTLGPDVDDDKTLAAYQAVLSRDSLNYIALNNAANILRQRRENEKALAYYLRAAAGSPTPVTWSNAMFTALLVGRWDLADSLQKAFAQQMPGNPDALRGPAIAAALRGDWDGAERMLAAVRPQVAGSRTGTEAVLGQLATVLQARGRLREAAALRGEQHARQTQRGSRTALLQTGLDSAVQAAVVLDDRAQARAVLARAVARAPLDSIPLRERNYDYYLAVATLVGDSARAREWHTAARRAWAQLGHSVDRAAWEAMDDGMLALSEGRLSDALAKVDESDQDLLARTDIIAVWRFTIQDRMQHADSALAAGESYLTITSPNRLGQDALFRPGIEQRLGELYEAKGNLQKALDHYQAFVDLWKNADPELQPRVRDVRGRVERLRAQLGKKG